MSPFRLRRGPNFLVGKGMSLACPLAYFTTRIRSYFNFIGDLSYNFRLRNMSIVTFSSDNFDLFSVLSCRGEQESRGKEPTPR